MDKIKHEVIKKGCFIWCNHCQAWINKDYIQPEKHNKILL